MTDLASRERRRAQAAAGAASSVRDLLASPNLARWLTIAIPIFFLVISAVRAFATPEASDPPTVTEDWEFYRQHASEIVHGGWLMPSITGGYQRPGGFAYNYALAGIFAVFGESTVSVEILQGAALGVCAIWLYRIFLPRLDRLSAVIYLISVAAFLFGDQFLYNTRRLLSENLLFLLLPGFVHIVLRAYEKGAWWTAPTAGIMGGVVMLTRPNLVPLVVATPLVWELYEWRSGTRLHSGPLTMLVVAAGMFGLMPLRNGLVTGQPSLQALTWTGDWQLPDVRLDPRRMSSVISAAQAIASFYAARTAFVLGLLPVLHPGFRVRPHWVVMWALAAVNTLIRARDRTPLAFWEALVYVWIALYLGPLVAVGAIDVYGFRMLVPIIPFVLLVACRYLGPVLRLQPALPGPGGLLRLGDSR